MITIEELNGELCRGSILNWHCDMHVAVLLYITAFFTVPPPLDTASGHGVCWDTACNPKDGS